MVSNQIGMTFGRNVLQVNTHRLTKSDFQLDVTLSRWRSWRHFMWKSVATWCEWTQSICGSIRPFLVYSTSVLVILSTILCNMLDEAVFAVPSISDFVIFFNVHLSCCAYLCFLCTQTTVLLTIFVFFVATYSMFYAILPYSCFVPVTRLIDYVHRRRCWGYLSVWTPRFDQGVVQ